MSGAASDGRSDNLLPAGAPAERTQQTREQARSEQRIVHGVEQKTARAARQATESREKRRELPAAPVSIVHKPGGVCPRRRQGAPAGKHAACLAAQDDNWRGQAGRRAARSHGAFQRGLCAKRGQRFWEGEAARRSCCENDGNDWRATECGARRHSSGDYTAKEPASEEPASHHARARHGGNEGASRPGEFGRLAPAWRTK